MADLFNDLVAVEAPIAEAKVHLAAMDSLIGDERRRAARKAQEQIRLAILRLQTVDRDLAGEVA